MMFRKPILVLAFLLLSISIFAQTSLIGNVADEKGKPIIGAIVYVDTIKTATKINAVGYFKIEVADSTETISVFSAKYGYLTPKYAKQERLSFVFSDVQKENQMAKNKTSSSALNTLNVQKDVNKELFTNIYQYIAGRVAGVSVNNDNEIIIRGGSSWELSNDPLFVVDGVVVNNIDNILPADVDQIQVLKGVDAAIYGSRGSSGVIEITTR